MSLGAANDQMPWTVPEEEALPILKHALDIGMNTWDTVSSVL
jgi:aryl-alcohol dehydrogenase-like predicted oxidoreductase